MLVSVTVFVLQEVVTLLTAGLAAAPLSRPQLAAAYTALLSTALSQRQEEEECGGPDNDGTLCSSNESPGIKLTTLPQKQSQTVEHTPIQEHSLIQEQTREKPHFRNDVDLVRSQSSNSCSACAVSLLSLEDPSELSTQLSLSGISVASCSSRRSPRAAEPVADEARHADVADALMAISHLLLAQGLYRDSEGRCREALSLLEPRHHSVAADSSGERREEATHTTTSSSSSDHNSEQQV